MGDDRPDPFVVGGRDSLAGLSPASVRRVRAFYRNCTALKPRELRALSDVGLDLLPDRGRWLPWSIEESYDSLTVLPRLVRPSKLWDEAIQEAQESLESLAATRHEEYRRLFAEEQSAKADYLAAERMALGTDPLLTSRAGIRRQALSLARHLVSMRALGSTP